MTPALTVGDDDCGDKVIQFYSFIMMIRMKNNANT
jgi:hypothetical protein